MPELDYAILSDYVRAEESGVSHVIAAGIDTVYAPAVPAGQNVGLLLRLTVTRNECDRPHRVEVIFQSEDGQRLVQATATVEPTWDESLPAGWRMGATLALNFGIPLPTYGLYSFEILINDHSAKSLNFRVVERPRTAKM